MKRSLFIAAMAFSTLFSSCAEHADDASIICPCGITNHAPQLDNEHDMTPDELDTRLADFDVNDTSDACPLITNAVIGQWQGILPSGNLRYEFKDDGTYDLFKLKKTHWIKRDSGRFWIEYHLQNGLLRAEIHMTLGGDEDYPMYFFIRNGKIVVQEHVGEYDFVEFERLPTDTGSF